MEQLPNRIRELRTARGLLLEQLAIRVGCSVTMLSDLERGKRDLGHVWMLRIAKALKVQPADLLLASENSRSLSADEAALIDLYAGADEAQRSQFMQMAKILMGQGVSPPKRRAANQ